MKKEQIIINDSDQSSLSGLKTVTMNSLLDQTFAPRPPVIDGILYSGTYIFVGPPKIGKSFLMAQIAWHVANGIPLWDCLVRKGGVLYLALEDDYARLQLALSSHPDKAEGIILSQAIRSLVIYSGQRISITDLNGKGSLFRVTCI